MTPHPVTTRLVDVGLAVGLAAVLWLRVAAPFEADASPPDWRAWVLAGLLGGVLLLRRRRPVGVLLASLGLLLLYYLLGFGAIGAVEPLAVALYTVAVHGRWRVGAMVAGALVVGSGVFRLTVEQEALTAGTLADVLNDGVLAAALLLAGAVVRSHRGLRAAVRQREAALRAEAEAQQRQRLSEQRLAIARDVHDVVAHALAAVGVHARLATEVLDDRAAPRGHARELVAGIGEVTRTPCQTCAAPSGASGRSPRSTGWRTWSRARSVSRSSCVDRTRHRHRIHGSSRPCSRWCVRP